MSGSGKKRFHRGHRLDSAGNLTHAVADGNSRSLKQSGCKPKTTEAFGLRGIMDVGGSSDGVWGDVLAGLGIR